MISLFCSPIPIYASYCLRIPYKKPAFYHNADPGPGSQTNVDLYPGQWSYLVTLVEFVHEK